MERNVCVKVSTDVIRIRSTRKENSFSSGLFLKGRGGLSIYGFLLLVLKMATMSQCE